MARRGVPPSIPHRRKDNEFQHVLRAVVEFVKIIHQEHLARCATTRAMKANNVAMKARLRGAQEQVGSCQDALRALTAQFEELHAAAALGAAQMPVPNMSRMTPLHTADESSFGKDALSSPFGFGEDPSSPDNGGALERQFFAVCDERDQLRARLRQALSSVDDMHARDVQSGAQALEQSLRLSRATHGRFERAETARIVAEQQLSRTKHKASQIKKRLLRAHAELKLQLSACGAELERERASNEVLTRRCSEGEGEIVLLKESLSLAEQRADEARLHAEEVERKRLLLQRESAITTPSRSSQRGTGREKGPGPESGFAVRYDRADRFMAETKIDLLERKVLRLESERGSTEELRFKLLAAIDREGRLECLIKARDAQIEDMRRQIARLETDFEEQSRFKEALLMVARGSTDDDEGGGEGRNLNLEILVEKGELSNVVAEVTQSAGTATGDGPVEMAEPES